MSLSILLLTGCVIVPIPGLFDSSVKKPYYNLSYIVTDECVKDIGKILVTDYGVSLNGKDDFDKTKNLMTDIIQNPPLDRRYARTMELNHNKQKLKFILSSEKNYLELVFFGYKKSDSVFRSKGFSTNTTNSSGLKEYTLLNCKI